MCLFLCRAKRGRGIRLSMRCKWKWVQRNQQQTHVLSTCQNIATAVVPQSYMTQPYMTQSYMTQSIPQTGMTQSYMAQSYMTQSIPQTGAAQFYMTQSIPQTGTAQSYMDQSTSSYTHVYITISELLALSHGQESCFFINWCKIESLYLITCLVCSLSLPLLSLSPASLSRFSRPHFSSVGALHSR